MPRYLSCTTLIKAGQSHRDKERKRLSPLKATFGIDPSMEQIRTTCPMHKIH